MTAKKIVHLHFGKEGGAERFFVNLARAFGERGMEQRFVIKPNRTWGPDVAALGPVIENEYRRVSLSSILLTWRVHRMIREWRPDVIMAWIPRASRLIPDYPDAVKVTRLGDLPQHLRHFRYCDFVVPISPAIADRCLALGWKKKLPIIANFPRQITPVPVDRASLGTPADAFVIVGVGRFVPRKAFPILIRAAARVPGAWLWLVGEGEERARLEALVAELGIAERTRFVGWVPEPMHYVAAADVFVIPSRHEPLGNVVFECWHSATPMVATRSEGPGWVIADNEDGLMVDIDDIQAMAAAIERVRSEQGLAARLVANGLAKLEAKFTRERIVDQYFEIFNSRSAGRDAGQR